MIEIVITSVHVTGETAKQVVLHSLTLQTHCLGDLALMAPIPLHV